MRRALKTASAALAVAGLIGSVAPAAAAGPATTEMPGPTRPAAVALPDLDALVSHETRQVSATGITRVDTWQERLVRRGGQVWVERVLPNGAATGHEGEAEHAGRIGHAHFDAETAARWLVRSADGRPELKLVDRRHGVVVEIPRAEYGSVGFDGSFEGAASIVPAAVARSMAPVAGEAVGGAGWRAARNDGWSHRVQWSERRQLALKVESQRDDGSVRRVVSVELRPRAASAGAPWQQLGNYVQKRYDDYMD